MVPAGTVLLLASSGERPGLPQGPYEAQHSPHTTNNHLAPNVRGAEVEAVALEQKQKLKWKAVRKFLGL